MLPTYFEFVCPVRIISGRKALSNLPHELGQMKVHKPLVITDKGVVAAKLLQKLDAALIDADMSVMEVFDETPVDSSYHVVNTVAERYRVKECDCIIALGGGSVIDTAKGVNIVVSEHVNDLLKLQGVDRIHGPLQPLIVIPTTAGTGSEATNVAVIINEDLGVKMALVSNHLYPRLAILDPSMTMTMPPKITAATGMDALTHSIEATVNLQKNPVSDALAAAAITLIARNILKATTDGHNEDARMSMANGALLAGMAFSNSMVGIVHALAHSVGGVAHVPHGVANSILLPFGMKYNLDKAEASLASLCAPFGLEVQGLTQRQKAEAAIAFVRDLKEQLHAACGLPRTLSEAGVKEDQLQNIATKAVNDGSLTYNPTEMDQAEGLAVLREAF